MTLKEIIDKHWNSIGAIEELCDGRFIAIHTCFGFLDDEPTSFALYGNGVDDTNTIIDGRYEVSLDGNKIIVKAANNLELTLIKLEVIDLTSK